jgi:hypothetical protein
VKTQRNFLLVVALCIAAASALAYAGHPLDPMSTMAFGAIGMTAFTEGNYAGEHIASEASGTRSREVITVVSGQNLAAGTVLGKIRGTASAAALGSNSGSGTIGTITLGAGALEGAYKLTIIEPASNAGNFVVEDPLGRIIGHGTVAVAFSAGGLGFTLADATDFVAGDSFTITVAAGTKYAKFDEDGTNGTEVAVAVLFDTVDASSADKPGVAHVRDCEVKSAKLTWGNAPDTNEKAAALASLASLGIIAR